MRRIRRVAEFLGLDPEWIQREMAQVVRNALARWPGLFHDLLDDQRARLLMERFDTLRLVAEIRA